MSDEDNNVVSVKILDRHYSIKCPPEQTHELQESVSYVNEHMKKIQRTTNMNSTDRIAVITALNISHELIQLRKQKNSYIDVMNQRILDLQRRIENFLASTEEVTV